MISQPNQNILLGHLSPKTQKQIFPLLQEVDLSLGEELFSAGDAMEFVYFPIDCVVSLVYFKGSGKPTEVSVVGYEGFVGVAVSMGEDRTPSRAVVQSPGTAYRLPTIELGRQLAGDSIFRLMMLNYTRVLIAQMAQTVLCSRSHTMEQQLCRWLLLSMDRLPSGEMTMSETLIADTLGVDRENVVAAAVKLEALGIIRYEHQSVTVLNRSLLEELSCDCYSRVIEEANRQAMPAEMM